MRALNKLSTANSTLLTPAVLQGVDTDCYCIGALQMSTVKVTFTSRTYFLIDTVLLKLETIINLQISR